MIMAELPEADFYSADQQWRFHVRPGVPPGYPRPIALRRTHGEDTGPEGPLFFLYAEEELSRREGQTWVPVWKRRLHNPYAPIAGPDRPRWQDSSLSRSPQNCAGDYSPGSGVGPALRHCMCKRSKSALLMVLLVLIGVSVWEMGFRRRLSGNNTTPAVKGAPVSLRYLAQTDGNGGLIEHPLFWVTNHTGKTLSVNVSSIQVTNESGWASLPLPSPFFVGTLDFTDDSGTYGWLPPHGAGFGRVSSSLSVPQDEAWRVVATVVELRTGVEDAVSRVRLQEKLARLRWSGKTNLPLNAFGKGIKSWGNPQQVTSEVVVPSAPFM